MRTLQRTLQDQDIGFLRVVCELWGFDPPAGPHREFASRLADLMLQRPAFDELIEILPDSAHELITHLLNADGRAAFSQVDRTYGPLREMGPGRRDRMQPWRQPASPLETVWYRGLLGRAFADSPLGPQEFIYIPDDVLQMFLSDSAPSNSLMGIAAEDPAIIEAGNLSAVDDATTLLAAFRNRPPSSVPLPDERRIELAGYLYQPRSIDLIVQLLFELGFIETEALQVLPERVGNFLEASRTFALRSLIGAWRDIRAWNDLAALPHLHVAAGDWPNDPRLSRRAAVDLLQPIPQGEWWDLGAFIADVRRQKPAFQRPGGDFEAWYLQDASGAFLDGIEHWESVDGAYLRFLIEGPIHWLGMADLGRAAPSGPSLSFRLTPMWKALLSDELSIPDEITDAEIIVHPNAEIIVPGDADRVMRYQIARISEWEPPDQTGHRFRLTPGRLEAARAQGLSVEHILGLLEKAAGSKPPPSVLRAVERWSRAGTEAHLANELLLRVGQKEILETLSGQKQTARFLQEILSPTTAVIRAADWPHLRDAAARLGLLIDPPGGA